MPMDFFDRQDRARRQTKYLMVMFAAAVFVIILAIYAIAVVVMQNGGSRGFDRGFHEPTSFWNPGLFAIVSLGTIVVISLGSTYKLAELASGGDVVAQMLGGRLVDQQTRDVAERRLLNIVEEMSIASGVPVPPVYVLDGESSINAFAAGHQPQSAVVAVSRGCLEHLTREELQGVLGHEFSHILNGDMRLNLRLIGIVYGILVLSIIGYYILRSTQFMGPSNSSRNDNEDRRGDNRAAIFFIGLALYILGYLGVFLGNIIKAAISRQREFLADASSVQFTRNPSGLAGALKKIGGLAEGSRINDPHAQEISHMFFGDAFAGSFFNLFATHPPLAERIHLLDPEFKGEYTATAALGGGDAVGGLASQAVPEGLVSGLASGVRLASSPQLASQDRSNHIQAMLHVGSPQPEHLEHAERMVAAIPPLVLDAIREPFSARGAIIAILVSSDDRATRDKQLQMIQANVEPPLVRVVQQLSAAVDGLPPENRLPLVDLAMPALKRLSPAQYASFRQMVESLTLADEQIDLFEYCLRVILFGTLDVNFGLRPAPSIKYKAIGAVAQSTSVVISALAYAGQSEPAAIQKAFAAGAKTLPCSIALVSPEQCNFNGFDLALGQLAESSPPVKRQVLSAIVACIAADGVMTAEESELLRAVAASLSCPLPPVPVS